MGDTCVICGGQVGVRVHYFKELMGKPDAGICGLCMDYIVELDLEIGYFEEGESEVGKNIQEVHKFYESLYSGVRDEFPEVSVRTLESIERLGLEYSDKDPEQVNLRDRAKLVVDFNKKWCEYEGITCEDVEVPKNFMMGPYLDNIALYVGESDCEIKKGILQPEDIEGGIITNMDELNLFKEYGTYYNNREMYSSDNSRGLVFDIKSPQEVEDEISLNVVGQDEAKKILSTEVYKHMLRYKAHTQGMDTRKSNILMTGSTGTGKTFMLKTLSEVLDIPLVIVDSTTYTEAGYVGDDVESIVHDLYKAAGDDVERAEWGMVYLDEVDKIASSSSDDHKRDVGGKGVQQSLLRLIEGTTVEVPASSGGNSMILSSGGTVEISTENILFIAGGAFSGIESVVESRLNSSSGIGFGKDVKDTTIEVNDLRTNIRVEDLVNYGMMREFIGRFPTLVNLHDLDESDLVKILKESENSILVSYKNLFKCMGKDLKFMDGSLEEIAKKAIKTRSGARSLHKVVDGVLNKAIYEGSSREEDTIIVDPNLNILYEHSKSLSEVAQ